METTILSSFLDRLFVVVVGMYVVALITCLYYYSSVRKMKVFDDRRFPVSSGSQSSPGAVAPSSVSSFSENFRTEVKRVRRARSVTQAFVYLAAGLHLLFVVMRGVSANRFPWANLFEYTVLFCLMSVLVSVFIISRNPSRIVFWPWLLTPLALLMFYAGTELHVVESPVVPSLKSGWYYIHVSTVSIGGAIGLFSGVLALLFVMKSLGSRVNSSRFMIALARPLPSALSLDSLSYRSAIWTLPIFGLGVIFGAIWAHSAWGRFWGWDPKETVSFITWILYACYLHARATPNIRPITAAWINVAALVTMVFNLFFINQVVSGLHSYAGLN